MKMKMAITKKAKAIGRGTFLVMQFPQAKLNPESLRMVLSEAILTRLYFLNPAGRLLLAIG